jgi:hypothetical protein
MEFDSLRLPGRSRDLQLEGIISNGAGKQMLVKIVGISSVFVGAR